MRELRLSGKVAIVTGAASGIGKATAIALAREGAKVVVNFHIQTADDTLNEIKALGRYGIAIQADVSNRREVEDMVEKTIEAFERIDILVNNAGITSSTPFEDITDKEWNRVMNVNLKGVFNCIQAVAEYMKKQRSGKIINIASSSGITGGSTDVGVHYAASKAGVIGLTKALAKQLPSYGISINAIAPGLIETHMLNNWSKEFKESVKERIPLGRFGRPEDVAEVVVFLASDEACYITGETIIVSGGFVVD